MLHSPQRSKRWPRKVVLWLLENIELLEILLIPFCLFMIDVILRSFLRIDLIDAGADMSLLAVSSFVALFINDIGQGKRDEAIIEIAFLLFFGILWLICLMFISDLNPLVSVFPSILAFRQFIVWGLGMMSFILASLFVEELSRSTLAA